MEYYRDWDHNSNILAYELGNDYVIVQFKSGRWRFYKYTVFSCGSFNITEMKRLAIAGNGLNEYIIRNKVAYDSKW